MKGNEAQSLRDMLRFANNEDEIMCHAQILLIL